MAESLYTDPRNPHNKIDYMKTSQFSMATDVNNRFVAHITECMNSEVPDSLSLFHQIPSHPTEPLAALATLMHKRVLDSFRSTEGEDFETHLGVDATDRDLNDTYSMMSGVTADFNFTWHFAPFIAAAVAERFAEEGELQRNSYEAMSLRDWAAIIRSPWFSILLHDMALAENGTYGGTGKSHKAYSDAHAKLLERFYRRGLSTDVDAAFVVGQEEGATAGQLAGLTASLHPEVRRFLRTGMKKSGSPGCTAARHQASFPPGALDYDPHLHALVERGEVMVVDKVSRHNRTFVTQERTSIDHTLEAMASVMDAYQDALDDSRPAAIAVEGLRTFVGKLPKSSSHDAIAE